MGVIGVLLFVPGLFVIDPIISFVMLGVLPMICIVGFMIIKHPVFGVAYTFLFFINRYIIVFRGTLLARILILLTLIYFIYVNWISIKDWKQIKKEKQESRI
ncbi:hypothetical protein JYG23_04540 [Sedimentibacter sp. zth1]|uniref:hypothetical protein n=1 Tax=Sedimentibacter sp. zth1 TaxID=2816908 RepID=UPI001A92CA2B|nr:hypothetical protein [Sedimentibacter sp. zth1]QSX06724.1 hypothetical protein JYG23_04540 [Sedimentibacter sp. zth1]